MGISSCAQDAKEEMPFLCCMKCGKLFVLTNDPGLAPGFVLQPFSSGEEKHLVIEIRGVFIQLPEPGGGA